MIASEPTNVLATYDLRPMVEADRVVPQVPGTFQQQQSEGKYCPYNTGFTGLFPLGVSKLYAPEPMRKHQPNFSLRSMNIS